MVPRDLKSTNELWLKCTLYWAILKTTILHNVKFKRNLRLFWQLLIDS